MVGVVFLALVNREFQKQSKKMRMLFSNTAFDYIPIQSSEFLENRNSGTNRHCGGCFACDPSGAQNFVHEDKPNRTIWP